MSWLWLIAAIAAIIVLRIIVAVIAVLGRNPWLPEGLTKKLNTTIGPRLSALGFEEVPVAGDDPDARFQAEYQNDRFQLEFEWDRQQLFAELTPRDLSIIPTDPTLPPLDERHLPSPPYSVWEMLGYVGVVFDANPYALRSPRLLNELLRQLRDQLPQLRPFLTGDLQIYIPFRRRLQIRQLRYDWRMRGSYKDAEEMERKTLAACRRYAQAWWDDRDFESAAQALEIIEEQLTDDELERLAEARRRAKKIG